MSASAVARTLPAMTAVQAVVAMGTFALSVLALAPMAFAAAGGAVGTTLASPR